MIRVLFISRYRDPTMDRKLVLMSEADDVLIRQVRPARWEDELLRVELQSATRGSLEQVGVPMLGRANDPHRAVYRTLDFGMQRFRPHIVHAEEEPDSLAALQISLARRLFASEARLMLYTWQNIERRRPPWVQLVQRLTLRAASGVLCANREAQTILQRRNYRGQTWVLPAIGVDTQVFRPCTNRPSEEDFVVGYVGRLVPEKGLDTLVAAVQMLGAARVTLRIIGDGPYRAYLQDHVSQLGLSERVRLDRPMPPHQVAAALCQMDVLVLPSRTTPVWKEQFGRVLVEAMACGIPVVGSDSGAIPEVISDAGLIFPEGDARALADSLQRLIASPALRRRLATQGHRRATSCYSQDRIAAQTVALYRKLLGTVCSPVSPGH
jgi:glycosyltransferase involved in cell wall biosynthesis